VVPPLVHVKLEALMDSIRVTDLVSLERINFEIQRRAFAMAQAPPETNDVEDPYTIASRQVFEELLMRFADGRKAA
jgi:hypothetical protein